MATDVTEFWRAPLTGLSRGVIEWTGRPVTPETPAGPAGPAGPRWLVMIL